MIDEQLIGHYLRYLATVGNLSENTIVAYRRDLMNLLAFWQHQGVVLEEAALEDSWLYVKHLRKTRRLGEASVNRMISSARTFYEYLLKQEKVYANPFALIAQKRARNHLPTTLTIDEVQALLALEASDFASMRDLLLFALLYRSMGAGKVIVLDMAPYRLDFAHEMGIDAALNVTQVDAPAEVKSACIILASYLMSTAQAPLGTVGGGDMSQAIRIAQTHPSIKMLMCDYVKVRVS